ncbi:MAG TPA: DMT family transporter [Candidatus Eisenbacteria bacterium]|nr:DMT family transporter [Candidatus Eisenbacteria bacterium]
MGPRLLAFIAVVFWGVSFVATRVALRHVSPITLVVTRFALGLLLLNAILLLRGGPLVPPRGRWRMLALLGFVGIFVHMLLQAYALTTTTAVRTGWLIGIIPIWSSLLAAIFLHERFGPWKVSGLILGFLGAVVVVTRGRLNADFLALPTTRGDLLVLTSTVTWAVYTVIGQETIRALGSLRATAGAMLFGWLMLVPFFLARRGWTEFAAIPPTGWGAILFLGLGCSGLAYWFWYSALGRVETSRVAAFLYLEPLVTVAAAVPLLGETVAASTIVGGAMVLMGVALVQRGGSRA